MLKETWEDFAICCILMDPRSPHDVHHPRSNDRPEPPPPPTRRLPIHSAAHTPVRMPPLRVYFEPSSLRGLALMQQQPS